MLMLRLVPVLFVTVSCEIEKTVDLNLETILRFDPDDTQKDLDLIAKLRGFLDNIGTAVQNHGKKHMKTKGAKSRTRRRSFGSNEDTDDQQILTNFLEELGVALLDYNDEDLKNITVTFYRELSKLYNNVFIEREYTEDVYKTLFSDDNIKNYVLNETKEWTKLDSDVLKEMIKGLFQENNEETVARIVRNLNEEYNEKDAKTFGKIVKVVKKFPEKQTDLSNVINKGLKYAIFDKYRRRNYDDSQKLLNYIQELAIHAMKQQNISDSLRKMTGQYIDMENKNIHNSAENIAQDSDNVDKSPNKILINKHIDLTVDLSSTNGAANASKTSKLQKSEALDDKKEDDENTIILHSDKDDIRRSQNKDELFVVTEKGVLKKAFF